MSLSAFSYNILRWIGLIGPRWGDQPSTPSGEASSSQDGHARTHVLGGATGQNGPAVEVEILPTVSSLPRF